MNKKYILLVLNKVGGSVTSLLLSHSGTEAIVASSSGRLVKVTLLTFSTQPLLTCPDKDLRSL